MENNIQKIRDMLKQWQCTDCQSGNFSHCNHTFENGKAFMEKPDGTRQYFCNIGCLLLQLDDEDMTHVIESQFNREGHYEKLFSEKGTYKGE